jgi:hypothetical protein
MVFLLIIGHSSSTFYILYSKVLPRTAFEIKLLPRLREKFENTPLFQGVTPHAILDFGNVYTKQELQGKVA